MKKAYIKSLVIIILTFSNLNGQEFIDSLNTIILKLIDLIMLSAPYGVFALLATLVVEAPSLEGKK